MPCSVCFNLARNVILAPGSPDVTMTAQYSDISLVSTNTRMATKIARVANISFPKLNAVYNF